MKHQYFGEVNDLAGRTDVHLGNSLMTVGGRP